MKKTIWTPDLYGHESCDFGVCLDRDFAKSMINSKISTERQNRLNELANNELKGFGINWKNPYAFHNNTCFISQFYIGQNGVWLSTNRKNINELIKNENLDELIKYNSHNVDTPKQAYVLMSLFSQWVEFSDAIRDK